ncbi:ATP-binding protein [Streptomyces sp. TRM S81-3]|uniref:ATP-binding protein n=1 Tax=Streptomyces griseicoloratus TaxID=2752516 RepID=A0A926KYB6_9ACTN|nr:ATP-binding protein [Streptomyces griseicoloratus]MBD0418445.1 ATP-binding protein [Streptomyces griseicoloratus]
MDGAARSGEQLRDGPLGVSAAYEGGSGDIARGRELARDFLARLREAHGLPVSDRAMDVVQLVVSELLTNACKYAPGPSLVDLRLTGGGVEVSVWDSDPVLPVAEAPDPGRVGRHGLEIVLGLCRSLEVHREAVGKRTTAEVLLADDPHREAAGRRP